MKHQHEHESEENSVAEYRGLNALIYARPSSGNLSSERTFKLSYPATLSSTMGGTIQFVVNSGSEYVWGPTCYLKCKLNVTVGGTLPTINGSFLNMISQVRMYHRSGELLELVNVGADILANIKLRYQTSYSDYVKLSNQIGAAPIPGNIGYPSVNGMPDLNSTGDITVNLPLSFFLGVFDNHSQYIPSSLLSGARIELVLNNNSGDAMQLTNLTINSVSPVLALDCCKLYDEASKQILEESSNVQESGIQFVYSTYFASQFKPQAGAINIDILQSASLTERAIVVNSKSDGTDKYSFRSLNTAGFSYQFRIGAHYLPIYSIADDTEAFNQAQIAFNGLNNQYSRAPSHTGVSVRSFYFQDATTNVSSGFGINAVYATSLEKSASGVSLSGEPTNNSRIINFSAVGTSSAFVTTVFLQYIRVANCMIDSCVVDR